jgi:hypothetical protein
VPVLVTNLVRPTGEGARGPSSEIVVPSGCAAIRIWTISQVAAMVCFLATLLPDVGWRPFHPSPVALLLVVAQPLVWSLAPLSLWMASECMPSDLGKRWARACVAISLVAWLTYDVADLHRLAPFGRSVTIMSISIPSIVPFGWWTRNLELLTTAVLMARLGTGNVKRGDTCLRWLNGLVGCVCFAVAMQCAELLVFRYKFARGVLSADRPILLLLAAGSVLMHVIQSTATVAVGVLVRRRVCTT